MYPPPFIKVYNAYAGLPVNGQTVPDLPQYATPEAAACDLIARKITHIASDYANRPRYDIGTGLRMEMPPGWVGIVNNRSGLGSRGFVMANQQGWIDSDYRGEIVLRMVWLGEGELPVRCGDRVAQMMFIPAVQAEMIQVHSLSELAGSLRGEYGFGSTGQ